jgi:uncharacterized DUF497 family protein
VAGAIGFDWDEANVNHLARHSVSSREAEEVMLNDPVEVDYQVLGGEERYVVVGPSNTGRFLTMVWTDRSGLVRVITAFESSTEHETAYWSVKGV